MGNVTLKYENDPANATAAARLTTTVENAKAISEREICDSSDSAAEFDEQTDSPRCQGQKSIALLSAEEPKRKDYTCDSCQRIFKRKYHLIRHIINCKNDDSISEGDSSTTRIKVKGKKGTDEKSAKQKGSVRSKKCVENTSDDDANKYPNLRSVASRNQSSGTYPCSYCEYTAEKRKLLNAHLTDAHPEFAKRNRKSFVDSETVLRARIEHNGKIYYHCSECGKNLNSPYTFYWHIRIHTGERLFTCHLCGKRFRINQGLTRHLRETHAGIKNIPCDLCGRMFSTRRNVEDHRRIHTGERPYVCNVCGKTFKQKASLFAHNRTHSDVFPFKCSYCGQFFRTRPPLMVHITKHTGEKPYACDVCGRCFRIKYELKRHRLIHSDEKPWHCTDCNLSFRQKRYLVNHKKLNHGSPRCLTAAK